ncbi:multidrug ABC transporter ATPase [Amycolatopsis mediterranei S699]|uniref:ATPase component of ABC-type multidrug transport system n=2 Tax=Amycolatopsis mediterranei TaxID=33910 RepID=A0A0H3D600_AMYMU|nr:ATP-binding cassette domain-containing protein [Amycolatopsis mediterranei]ADJ44953.1 ATPase component of ABC-type multidrug transport system [Amycolatopsis mediterranei U32]AEK41704.1 multidrug ABC transporter ATPase [Amycolatopsis mediterranei S699]AFO76664.1 multidrug ABC transporter ATPase [Amycolatopsis mediterranei S699]AGT83792.1 multidrug ABC transporter ATPase [Amycolatopsis mediterranei RB]KDO07221.1 multidrug ABC transporter ATP-binding protein [Amycolatopsis mediterranei]
MTIEIRGLTKRYGPDTVVDDLSFTVHPGQVTGFLGPNGAGKSTTMKMIVGLAAPTRGSVTIGGRRYRDLAVPLTEVGALLDAGAVHGGRKARDHLLALAVSNGLPRRRVGEVLGRTGLDAVAGKRAGGFSLGMRQRLGLAAALLGDPRVLIFDEPVNGLDPEGIRWIRDFMRSLAGEGRAVLVSSHLMSEMAQTADHLVVIGRGRLVADTTVSELVRGEGTVLVRTAEPGFARLLTTAGAAVREGTEASLVVSGMTSAEIGKVAAYHGVALAELTPQRVSLEDAFMELTKDRTDYQGAIA